MVAENIKEQIKKALKALKFPDVDVELEHPENEKFGDYSSNVALKLKSQKSEVKTASQKSKLESYKTPRQVAEAITKKLISYKLQAIEKTEVAGPGFINFWLSEHFLLGEVKRVLNLGEKHGRNTLLKSKKVMVEYTDPNPFKEFHIGHLYSNVVGESLARLSEASGATVKRANYQGDVGLHVAKSLWGMRMLLENGKLQMEDLEKRSLKERVKFLGKAYAMGGKAYDEEAKQKIEELNIKIYAQDPEILELYERGRQWSLDYFETIYARLGTQFDYYYFERDAGKVGLDLVKKGLKKGIFQESQGAVVFPGEKQGLHTRVFINSQGLPTYEAKDLGLAPTKYKDFAYDKSIIVTANEVDEYFRVVLAAMSLVNPKLGKRTRHISHGMVRLPGGKMSSRTGEVLTGEWLLNEAKRQVFKIIRKSGSLEKKFEEEVAEVVGSGAVKYALLRSNIGRDISFNFDESVSFEGNSGPYLQYTYARCRSVLAKSKVHAKGRAGKSQKLKVEITSQNLSFNQEELAIVRWLYRFPEVVQQAGEEYAPSLVCGFLYELAQRYNAFYSKHRIIQAEEKNVKDFRLAMTAAVAQALKSGLLLLGIKAPSKM